MSKTISITWRNENYGRISGAVAFRASVEPFPSETESKRLGRLYRKCGFDVNHQRACWMAEESRGEPLPVRLDAALREAGYDVVHGGAIEPDMRDAIESARDTAVEPAATSPAPGM